MRIARFYVNGIRRELLCEQDKRLLDVIRKDLGLTGTKRGCDNEGYCGACSVIMDGKVVRSCLTTMKNVPDDAKIVTVEGIGTLDNPHPIQKAFAYEGAIQCGFCTPGMIVVAKALLDKNPNPSEEEIRHAFRGNLCRCAGYGAIIRAVQLAGRLLRGEVKEKEIKVDASKGTFGKRIPRPTSLAKATGAIQFGDDIPMPPDTLHLKIVRSPHHHANINSIDTSEAEKMPGVVGVLTAKDIPGSNRLSYPVPRQHTKYAPNDPILCDKKVAHWGCPIAIVVGETVEQAAAAVDKVEVEYEVLPTYDTPKESLAEGAIPILSEYDSNLTFTGYLKKCGDREDAEKAMEDSDAVVSGRFVTSRQAHLFIEPDNATAFIDEDDRITIMSKSSGIHMHIAKLSSALGVGPDKLRWIENPSGGSFGLKASITCEGLVALAAMKFRRPCKLVCTMAETILTTGKRPRIWVNAKMGATKDGYIKSLIYDFDLDCGGYESLAGMFLYKIHQLVGGPHNIPKAYGEGRIVLTNTNPPACFRGIGGPKIAFVSEILIDMMAEKLGMDPLEFRYQNAWREGDIANWGIKLDCYPYPAMLEKLRPLYKAAKERAGKESTDEKKRGVGIGAGAYGCERDNEPGSTAWVELNPDNGVTVYATWADGGQGGDIGVLTAASKAMGGLPPEKIRLVTRDSSLTPDSGPSNASRQTSTTGNAIRLACESLLKAMKDNDCKNYDDMVDKKISLRYEEKYVPEGLSPVDENCQGVPIKNVQYNLQMAEVEVEIVTGKVNVLKMTSVVDAGIIHNPISVEGQCEGGVHMGVGYGLWEDFEPGETTTLIKGGIPNFRNSPPVECHYNETFRPDGTFGGTGVGESVMFGAAPAIVNAIYDACGARIFELPAKPERVLAALKVKQQS